jgi:phosphopantothenoylcysteine decarboxylase / phosphopantothenate---cysteine ligase
MALGSLVRKRITVCVSGSIAAYKAVLVVRALLRAGAIVQPVMTRSARRFVGPATLSGLTGRPVHTDMFGAAGELHVSIARDSDLILVLPATADLLARLAHGRADDLLTATLLCARCPVLIAPAMHPNMWEHPATRRNAEQLRSTPGWQLLEPVFGEVASGETGVGRLLEPELIVAHVAEAAARLGSAGAKPEPQAAAGASLAGRHVVVTAGPTVEDLDPVRFLTNRSSGKMGFAIASAAAARGAEVTLIAGPVSLSTPPGVRRVNVRSALDMQAALADVLGEGLQAAHALIMCAAVSDYRPRVVSSEKLKRSGADTSLELVPNPDLLAEIGRARHGKAPFLLGFAVETAHGEPLERAARLKLAQKRVDAIVANAASDALGTDETRAVIVTPDGALPLAGSKQSVSDAIVEFVADHLP